MSDRIKIRRDTSSAWAAADPVLAAGEQGLDTTTGEVRVGDGVSTWTALGTADRGLVTGAEVDTRIATQAATDSGTYVAKTRAVATGTGLTGGGDLTADRTLVVDFAASGVSSATKATRADDSRLTNARTPTAHKSSHATGGSDILTPADIGAAPTASPTFTTTQATAPLSAEMLIDPGFDNPAQWTVSGLASITGSAATYTGAGSVSQQVAVTAGERYQVVLTTSAATAGNVTVTLGDASASRESWNNKSFLLTPGSSGTVALSIAVDSGSWTIDSATVKRITGYSVPAATAGAAQLRAPGTNTAVGASAQRSLTTGSSDTAFGHSAQYSLTTGYSDTAVGYSAQYSLTTGSSDTAFGHSAQYSLTTGYSDTAVGVNAQYSLTTGYSDTAIGVSAQYSPLGNTANATTTASHQTSVGVESGQSSATQVNGITTIGYRATAGAANATSLGRESRADHAGSVALGYQTTTTATDQIMCGPRDIEITNATRGLILISPGGTRYRITVANGGALTTTAA